MRIVPRQTGNFPSQEVVGPDVEDHAAEKAAVSSPQPALSPEDYKMMLDHLVDGVYFVDLNRNITYWNPGAEKLTGYSKGEVVGRCCADNFLVHVDDAGTQLCTGQCPLTRAMADRNPHTAEVYLRHKSGHRVPVSVRVAPILDVRSNVLGAVEIFSDISLQKAAQARVLELEQMAFLDSLTQIGNRRYLEMNLERMVSELHRYGNPFGILLFDIDLFKSVNDRYGHSAGDAVLTAVARTLAVHLRTSDLIGRWGGEEFLALLPHITRDQLGNLAQRCRMLVEKVSVPCGPARAEPTISCGGTMAEAGDTLETAVARADECLYRSKKEGRNRVTIAFRDNPP
jgi:diguanylate cyclase (GGDEF)-like protein/PAS domain S-box-containing protein